MFTTAAEFTLHSIGRLSRLAFADTAQQSGQIQQVCDPQERPALTHDDLRIRCYQIRPLWGNRANGPILSLEQESPPVAVVPFAHTGERLPAEWMEGMRYPHKGHACNGNACILD
jgi:hypothetical protein